MPTKTTTKRPLNAFMLKQQQAKEVNADHFEYNGKTYVRCVGGKKNQLVYYKVDDGKGDCASATPHDEE